MGGGMEEWRRGGGGKHVHWDDYLLNQRKVSSTGGRHVGV